MKDYDIYKKQYWIYEDYIKKEIEKISFVEEVLSVYIGELYRSNKIIDRNHRNWNRRGILIGFKPTSIEGVDDFEELLCSGRWSSEFGEPSEQDEQALAELKVDVYAEYHDLKEILNEKDEVARRKIIFEPIHRRLNKV